MPTRVDTGGLVLEPLAESARAARRYVREELLRLGREELLEAAELGVSELSANVALHARTPFTVAVTTTTDGTVRICVTDSSRVLPQTRSHGRLSGTGRGLRLVGAAGRWGVEPTDGGKTVWFEPRPEIDESALFDGLDVLGLAL